jgi:predicted CXXCH cytochrome family protein
VGATGPETNMKRARILLSGALVSSVCLCLLCLCVAASALAAGSGRLAPIADVESASRHAPYEMGQCEVCHAGGGNGRAPGPIVKPGNALCFDCHDEFKKAVTGHPAAAGACTSCHSPHNSRKRKLLL